MPSYMLRGLPAGLVVRAKSMARAHDTDLDTVLAAFLESYATHGPSGSKGGQNRATNLTAEERSAIARKGAEAKWKAHRDNS